MWSAYFAAYSIMQLWLWGSFFLIMLLFLRWCGSTWKSLNWLNCTKKRWLKIWSCFGVFRVIGFAIIYTLQTGFLDLFADRIGWPAQIVTYALPTYEIPVPIVIVLLGGIAEAIIRCSFAAFAWWIFSWGKEIFRVPRIISQWEMCGMSLLASACLLGIANKFAFYWQYPRMEEHVTCGVPFAFFQVNGGFVYSEYFVWSGVIWNALVMVGFSAIIAAIWSWILRRR
jgi:hypothetical protein